MASPPSPPAPGAGDGPDAPTDGPTDGPVGGRTSGIPRERTGAGEAALPPAGAGEIWIAQPTMKVAVVARRLGVAPATLRTWARRYGLGPSAHTAGAHRQYSGADLERLLVMRRLTLDGVAPSEAARVAILTGQDLPESRIAPVVPLPRRSRLLDDEGVARLQAACEDLRAAAAGSDALRCTQILDVLLAEHGVLETWEHVVLPVLRSERSRWDRAQVRTDVTPMLADCLVNSLNRAFRPVGGAPQVVLACAEGEEHSLGLHVLAAALWEQGTPTRSLGPRVPREELATIARQTEPRATVVLAVLPVRDHHQLHGLPGVHPGMTVIAAGPGWSYEHLPTTVHRAATFRDLVAELAPTGS